VIVKEEKSPQNQAHRLKMETFEVCNTAEVNLVLSDKRLIVDDGQPFLSLGNMLSN